MRWLKFILSHSIFISICAAALSVQAYILLALSPDRDTCLLVFFLTLAGYNFYWLISKFGFSKPAGLISFIKANLSNLVTGMISVTGLLILLAGDPEIIEYLIIPAILTIVYSIPLWPVSKPGIFEKLGAFKTFLLALTWTYTTILVPLRMHITEIYPQAALLFGARFFFMLMLCLIFDSRDKRVDQLRALSSLATHVSSRNLAYIFNINFILFIAAGFAFRYWYGSQSQLIAFLVTAIVTWLAYRMSLKPRGYVFYYFFIDGLMLFSAAATYLASI